MSSDLNISAAPSVSTGAEVVGAARPSVVAPTPVARVAAPASTANPTLERDAVLGLVVIRFHNGSGAMVRKKGRPYAGVGHHTVADQHP
jgi:hypothetical protein